jgi:hypothetical protein
MHGIVVVHIQIDLSKRGRGRPVSSSPEPMRSTNLAQLHKESSWRSHQCSQGFRPGSSVVSSRRDRIVLHQLVAGEAAGVRRRQVAAGKLLLELLLGRHDALAQRLDIEASVARLGEQLGGSDGELWRRP